MPVHCTAQLKQLSVFLKNIIELLKELHKMKTYYSRYPQHPRAPWTMVSDKWCGISLPLSITVLEFDRWHTKEQGMLQIDWVCVPSKSE